MRLQLLPQFLLVGLLGCNRGLPDVEVDEAVPTVLTLRWTSVTKGSARVEYGRETIDSSTPDDGAASTEHEVVVFGLKAGQTYLLQGVVTAADGSQELSPQVEVDLDPAPADLPRFTLTTESDDLLPGYVLTSMLGPNHGWLVILDQDGDPVWYHAADNGLSITSSRPSRDGKSLLHSQYDIQQRTDLGGVVRVPMVGDGRTLTTTELAHHDFAELADGVLAWISLDIREAEVEGEVVDVAGDRVLYGPEGGEEGGASELFSYFDLTDPWVTCSHFDSDTYGTGAKDWVHANSLMVDPETDDLFIMSKNQDSILKLDGQSGEVLWQIGGRDATIPFVDGTSGWSHSHMSQIWDDGFMVFDNGYHNGGFSRITEYRLDEAGGSVAKTFEYVLDDGLFVELLGDVRKLPDDTYLASWTSLGMLNRVNADGEVTWQAEAEIGSATGRVTFIEDLYTLDQD
jgi:Arylsulfotransferase (ASST)